MKEIRKNLIVCLRHFVLRHPLLKQALLRVLKGFPSGKERLKRVLSQAGRGASKHFRPKNVSNLSPRALQVLRELKYALNRD